MIRNKCTIVESPTCGKALVFSLEVMDKYTKRFAGQIMKFAELEFRSREEKALYSIRELQILLDRKE